MKIAAFFNGFLTAAIVFAAAGFVLAGCGSPTSSGSPKGKGTVTVRIGFDDEADPGDGSHVLPLIHPTLDVLGAGISNYEIAFKATGGGANLGPVELVTDGEIYDLTEGAYTVMVTGYNAYQAAAIGKITDLVVTGGENTDAEIFMEPYVPEQGPGTGSFSYSITVPGAASGTLSIWQGTSQVGGDITLSAGQPNTGVIDLTVGVYSVVVKLSKGMEDARADSALHIYYGLASPFTVSYTEADFSQTVTDNDLTSYFPAPVSGAKPVQFFEAYQYTGTIVWKEGANVFEGAAFAAGTAYTALVTLTAKQGYTFIGVQVNFFTHGNKTNDNTNTANTGVLTFTFTDTATGVNPSPGPELDFSGSNPVELYYDFSLTVSDKVPAGKTLVIKAGKTLTIGASADLTAGKLKLGPGIWKATNADVTIEADTVSLGSHAAPGFGAADGNTAAVLTGGEAATNTFTASSGAVSLGQNGNSLTITGSDANPKLTLGTTARFYVAGNTALDIAGNAVVNLAGGAKVELAKDGTVEIGPGSKIAAGLLEMAAGTWKATGGTTYTWNDIPAIDTGVHISENRIDLGNSKSNKFGKDDGSAATTLASPFENKWAAGSSYVASMAKVTIGQNGNALIITGASGAKLTSGASAGFWVKGGLTITNVTLDMSAVNDWESVIYLTGENGITLADSSSVLLFNNDSEGTTYPLEHNSADIKTKITIGSGIVVKAIWNDSWKGQNNTQNNERFASFNGNGANNTITRQSGESTTVWLTKNLKFKD
jgi:hypothetical protein